MYYGKVEISGINTSKLKVLTESEKAELLARTASGDMQARETLINGNLRLVLSVIQRFAGRGESPDDLFQVGCIGLIKAIDNFSPEYGVKFSTYAVPMIYSCRNGLQKGFESYEDQKTGSLRHRDRSNQKTARFRKESSGCRVSRSRKKRTVHKIFRQDSGRVGS